LDDTSRGDALALADNAAGLSVVDGQHLDASHHDAPHVDAPRPDATGGKCASLDTDTVLLLSFDQITGDKVPDSAGTQDGQLVGTQKTVAAPTGCGNALHIPGGLVAATYVLVPHDPAWDLKEGSLDFWVRFDAASSKQTTGIVGRDAMGTAFEGHITVLKACDDAIVVRLQRGGSDKYVCSDPIPSEAWTHVGLNFGPKTGLQLYVDGKLSQRTGTLQYTLGAQDPCGQTANCDWNTTGGIDGNTNPWVIGGYVGRSSEGGYNNTEFGLAGAIDHFRLSKTTRSFSP
jgi:hypothetical protein